MSTQLSEFELIDRLFAPLATTAGARGLKDDVAEITVPAGQSLAVTTDTLVGGVHFLPDDPPDTIAKKALGVNISDLAAKGATPAGFFLALSLPAAPETDWLEAFSAGLSAYSRRYAMPLLGGDTTSTPGPLTITITATGFCPAGAIPHRGGARPGDYVFVSGTIGDAGGGLEILQHPDTLLPPEQTLYLAERYRVPSPRLALGQALRGHISASLDVSDGLIADLGHIAETSHIAIRIEGEKIPRSPALSALWGDETDGVIRAATAGDDYELAFTAPDAGAVMAAARACKTPVSCIGRVERGNGVCLYHKNQKCAVSRAGYRHI